MKPSFSPEYAFYLGFSDGREYGCKDRQRDFKRDATDARSIAYFQGLAAGVAESQRKWLDMRCLVHWDNPGFDTPCCESIATHVGFAYGHVLPLCERHSHAQLGKPEWSVIPLSWL